MSRFSLSEARRKTPTHMRNTEIALGFNNTIDYETHWNPAVIEGFIQENGIRSSDIVDLGRIATLRDLVCSMLFHFRAGTGCGRYIESFEPIDRFIKASGGFTVTLGGTGVRAAIALSRMGCGSRVHLVSLNDELRDLLPADVDCVCSDEMGGCSPHLAVQYSQGDRVDANDIHWEAARANRVIYTHDEACALLRIAPRFFEDARNMKIMVLSGFDLVQDKAVLVSRLSFVREHLASLPEKTCVFYEDASFARTDFHETVWERLRDSIDVYSMNEDELQACLGEKIELLDVGAVLSAIRRIRERIGVPTLVVHTRHWALAHGGGASRYRSALRGGITMATTRFLNGDTLGLREYRETEAHPSDKAAARFAAEIENAGREIVCLPSHAERETNVITIGLGDAFVGGFVRAYAREH